MGIGLKWANVISQKSEKHSELAIKTTDKSTKFFQKSGVI